MDFLVERLKNSEEFLGKAFDDIYRINLLDGFEFEKVVKAVFLHRQTPLEALPIQFATEAAEVLHSAWQNYHEKTFASGKEKIPNAIKDVIALG